MRRLAAAALLACACHKAPPKTASADALWALAPEGTELGLVATPHATAMLARAAGALHEVAGLPDFQAARGAIDGALTGVLGAPGAAFADAGFATDRGFALFVTADGVIGVLPVGDRARFLAAKHGERGTNTDRVHGYPCREVRGRYACATSEAMFARLGSGVLGRTVPSALAGTRGDVEVYAPDVALLGGGRGDLALAARLQPGALDLDARWTGHPTGLLAQLAGARAPQPDTAGAAGFLTLDAGPLRAAAPPVPLAGGVTLAQLAASLRGPISIVVPAGTVDPELRAPLADPEPARTVIDHCSELSFGDASQAQPGTCRIVLRGLALDAWLDHGELRIAERRGGGAAPAGNALTPAGAALAHGAWSAAVWGRGTLLAPSGASPGLDVAGEAALGLRAFALVDELGAGVAIDANAVRVHATVRTLWANPPDVVAKVLAISAQDVLAGRAAPAAQAIAQAAPGSPFAADLAAGQGGLLCPALVFGTIAELAVPELGPYLRAPAAPASPAPGDAAAGQAALLVRAYADQAFPAWAAAHPGAACPASLDELAGYLHLPAGLPARTDPWNHPYVLRCGSDGVGVMSLGPDGRRDTADDVRSW